MEPRLNAMTHNLYYCDILTIKLMLLIDSLGSRLGTLRHLSLRRPIAQYFKHVVDYYTNRRSHVYVCFADFSKAFDKVEAVQSAD